LKIGLIAMSGVRAHNEELTRLGLTLPGFVDRNKIIASLPSLGLLTLAGMTPERFDVRYLEVSDIREVDGLPGSFDLVGISTYSAQIFEAYELADRFRAAGVRVVIGGPHVTCLPEEAQAHCDAVVVGEGEAVWEELLHDAERGSLKSVYSSREREFDFKDAPLPRFDLLDPGKYNRLTVQTSRGCPHRCTFCGASVLITPRYKQKPAAKVLEEVRAIKKIWKKPFIELADDNSFVHKKYWKELLGELKKENIRWFTETDISVAEDEELLSLLRESGCQQVLIGLESPAREGLDQLEMNSNWKAKRLDRYKEAIARIQKHGVTVNGCFILGLDGHGPDIFDKVLNFVRESGLYEVQITVMTAFPGTPLYDQLKREKRILHDGDWAKCTLFDVNYAPQKMAVRDLEKGFRDLAEKIYSAEFTQERRSKFKKVLRQEARAARRPRSK